VDKIVVIGGGGHAKVVISILKKMEEFELIGYVDMEDRGEILGLEYIGSDKMVEGLLNDRDVIKAVLGIGQLNDSSLRRDIARRLAKSGFSFPPIISPNAIVNEGVEIAEGTVVMDGVIINTGAMISRFCIINTRASIDHDCSIGEFTHIAPGATLSGGVEIGSDVLVGTGASIIQYRKIADSVIIGAGSAVWDDINDPGTYGGVPVRKIGR
jgi:sugar O-acyltransferase (sialic acid O-acetyltransferase NeuD family)